MTNSINFSKISFSDLDTISSKKVSDTLSETLDNNVSVDFTVTGTAGGSGTDYKLANGTLMIDMEQTSGTIKIDDILDDSVYGVDQNITPTRSNPKNTVLRSNVNIIISCNSFAAIQEDGSVVTCDGADFGRDSSLVADYLSSVVTKLFISSSSSAFATLKIDTRKNAVSVKELFRNILFKFRQNNSFRCFTTKAHNG